MKKIISILIFILFAKILFTNNSEAQTAKINLYSSYYFDDGLEAEVNNISNLLGTVHGNYQWGAGVEYIFKETYGVELIYFGSNTSAVVDFLHNQAVSSDRTIEMNSSFIMVSGNKYLPVKNSIVNFYGSLMAGMSIFIDKDPLPDKESTYKNFAWGLRLGSEFKVSKYVGLNLNTQLLSTVQPAGRFYVDPRFVNAITSETSLYQFSLGGGLCIYFVGK
ncbi:MAG TPA: hypothetical protein PLX80_08660 [Ignavibacteria bacterium]|nr:hypothetical protein [Ignavibacteria bacterium]